MEIGIVVIVLCGKKFKKSEKTTFIQNCRV